MLLRLANLSASLTRIALASSLLGCSSPEANHAHWMSDIVTQYPERELTLGDICWPRSHDTGTYSETMCRTRFSSACNTQTQHLTMAGQLAAGARARAASWTYAESTAGLVQALDAILGSAPGPLPG